MTSRCSLLRFGHLDLLSFGKGMDPNHDQTFATRQAAGYDDAVAVTGRKRYPALHDFVARPYQPDTGRTAFVENGVCRNGDLFRRVSHDHQPDRRAEPEGLRRIVEGQAYPSGPGG